MKPYKHTYKEFQDKKKNLEKHLPKVWEDVLGGETLVIPVMAPNKEERVYAKVQKEGTNIKLETWLKDTASKEIYRLTSYLFSEANPEGVRGKIEEHVEKINIIK